MKKIIKWQKENVIKKIKYIKNNQVIVCPYKKWPKYCTYGRCKQKKFMDKTEEVRKSEV